MGAIFISYRRSDSIGIVGRIFDKLAEHFDERDVYMDIDTIPTGVDFVQHIYEGVTRADVVLAVIGKTWLSARTRKGRRLDDPNDFVRIELETALRQNIPIIPVLLGSTQMPKVEQLPPSLQGVTQFNASHIDVARDFHVHMERLIKNIELLSPQTEENFNLESEGDNELQSDDELPGTQSEKIISGLYQESDTVIIIIPEKLELDQSTMEISFLGLVDTFKNTEISGQKKKTIVWVVDLGGPMLNDKSTRRKYQSVQQLLLGFKALRSNRYPDSVSKRQWLNSRSVVVILDTHGEWRSHEKLIKFPDFSTHHATLSSTSTEWMSSSYFRALYGSNLEEERMRQRVFLVFFNHSGEWPSALGEKRDLRYVGFASYRKRSGAIECRGLELPSLPARYADAFRTVCVAADAYLGQSFHEEAIKKLKHLGLRVLGVDEFLEQY